LVRHVYLYYGSTEIRVSVMSTLCCYMLLFRRTELSCLDVLMVANGRKRAEASESCQLCYTTPGLACVPQRPAAAPAARLIPFVPFRPLSRPRASQAVPLHGSGCAYVLFRSRRHLASSPRGTLWMPCHALTAADAPATASGPAADARTQPRPAPRRPSVFAIPFRPCIHPPARRHRVRFAMETVRGPWTCRLFVPDWPIPSFLSSPRAERQNGTTTLFSSPGTSLPRHFVTCACPCRRNDYSFLARSARPTQMQSAQMGEESYHLHTGSRSRVVTLPFPSLEKRWMDPDVPTLSRGRSSWLWCFLL